MKTNMTNNDYENTTELAAEDFDRARRLLKCLSVRTTFVRGLLACDPAFTGEVEKTIAWLCQTFYVHQKDKRPYPKGVGLNLSRKQLTEIFGMKPDEFALFAPFLRRRLRGNGYTKPEILRMLKNHTWSTPNFSLPPNLVLPPDDVILKTGRTDKKFREDPFTYCYWDEAVKDYRVAVMAPPLPMWKSEFAGLTECPRKLLAAKSNVYEMEGLREQAERVMMSLSGMGLSWYEVQDLMARFSWSGPKYGVRSGAPKTKAQSVA